MICCKERDKKHWFRKLCMQWTELAAVGFTTRPNKIFSLFSVIKIMFGIIQKMKIIFILKYYL